MRVPQDLLVSISDLNGKSVEIARFVFDWQFEELGCARDRIDFEFCEACLIRKSMIYYLAPICLLYRI